MKDLTNSIYEKSSKQFWVYNNCFTELLLPLTN